MSEEEKEKKQIPEAEEKVTKRIMAQEVYKQTIISRNVAVAGIAATLILAVMFTIHKTAGAIAAAILCGAIGIFLSRDVKFMKYLEDKYNIKPAKSPIPRPQNK